MPKFILNNETPSKPLIKGPTGPLNSIVKPYVGPHSHLPIIPNPADGMKRAANFNADYGGCGYWRMLWPEMLVNMNQLGIITGSTAMIMEPRYYNGLQTLRIQRQATPLQLEFAKFVRNLSNTTNNFKMIYEIDDIVFREDIPDYNSCKKAFDNPIVAQTAMDIMKLCDEITVTCDFMRDYYTNKTGVKNVTVVPNYVPKSWMDRFYSQQKISDRYEKNKKRPRIGYLGSGTHMDARNAVGQKDDFYHVNQVIEKTIKEFQWVFVGAVPHLLRKYVHTGDIEFHKWTSLNDYPYLFDKADVSITIAPLQDNTFNRAKSNIKYLEAGCFGIPCVCQDLITYKQAPLKFTTGDEMIDQIRKLTRDRQYYMKQSKSARQYAETMWMEDHLDEYVQLYQLQKDN